jgi:serine/threonine-protein kinase
VPAGLDVVIDRCLQKNRADRYADIGELALALGVFASKRAAACVERVIGILDSAGEAPASTRSASLSRSSAVAPRTEEQTKVTWGQTTPPRFGSRGWLLVGSIGFGAALGIGLLAWSQSVGLARAQSASPVAMTARVDEKLEQPRVLAVNSASVATDDPKTPVLSASPPVEDDPRAEPVVTAKNPAAPGAQSAATSSSSKAEKAARATSGSPKRAAQPANSRLDNAKHQPGAPRVECDPPYTLDALGRKHFKAECYLNQAQ